MLKLKHQMEAETVLEQEKVRMLAEKKKKQAAAV